jgi:hypothetical protein
MKHAKRSKNPTFPRVHVKDYKNYIPPGGRSPEKNEGGGVSILPNFIALQQNEGGWGV